MPGDVGGDSDGAAACMGDMLCGDDGGDGPGGVCGELTSTSDGALGGVCGELSSTSDGALGGDTTF